MDKHPVLTRGLAIAGVLLVWVPFVAPVLFSLMSLVQAGRLRVDYLMPGELAPTALLGGAALMWAAFRARTYRRIIATSYGVMVGLLLLTGVLAWLTGLATGSSEPSGWRLALVLGSYIGYVIALFFVAVSGLAFIRDVLGDLGSTTVGAEGPTDQMT